MLYVHSMLTMLPRVNIRLHFETTASLCMCHSLVRLDLVNQTVQVGSSSRDELGKPKAIQTTALMELEVSRPVKLSATISKQVEVLIAYGMKGYDTRGDASEVSRFE